MLSSWDAPAALASPRCLLEVLWALRGDSTASLLVRLPPQQKAALETALLEHFDATVAATAPPAGTAHLIEPRDAIDREAILQVLEAAIGMSALRALLTTVMQGLCLEVGQGAVGRLAGSAEAVQDSTHSDLRASLRRLQEVVTEAARGRGGESPAEDVPESGIATAGPEKTTAAAAAADMSSDPETTAANVVDTAADSEMTISKVAATSSDTSPSLLHLEAATAVKLLRRFRAAAAGS